MSLLFETYKVDYLGFLEETARSYEEADMRLTLKNIGKIEDADVKIDGITIIAGENNTGKSTVGKALFSVFNGFYKIDDQIKKERASNIGNLAGLLFQDVWFDEEESGKVDSRIFFQGLQSLQDFILLETMKHYSHRQTLKDNIRKRISDFSRQYRAVVISELNLDRYVNKVEKSFEIPDDDIAEVLLQRRLEDEFDGQINSVFSDSNGRIELEIRKRRVQITIQENKIIGIEDHFDLRTEAVYIDDPFMLDNLKNHAFMMLAADSCDHRAHLISKLRPAGKSSKEKDAVSELLTNRKLENIFRKLNEVCRGNIVFEKPDQYLYRESGTDKTLNIMNLSTGLKTFVIIKTLLQNGTLEENGTMILDEPEIHLHPEWQLIFAELIVLIQKEFGMHILINTHSPYFLNAVEVYSAKHSIADKCRYYMSVSQGKTAVIEDVTDHTEAIYQKLAYPLQRLENERYGDV